MSVHSTHYDDPEEYERDLAFEYRREQWEQDHLNEIYNIEVNDYDEEDRNN